MIGLVDGNNFYVSCERIFDLSLEGKPVAVLSNNDGCVISRSNECKALSIPMGMPYFQLRPLLAKYKIIVKSSNYELYGDISRRVISVLREFTPDVEQYSIDEAFIRAEPPPGTDFNIFGKKIRETILRWIGIPCGVGFAPTKTLAKIANHIGKKLPGGVFVMDSDPRSILEDLSVSEVWGVGRRLAPKLAASGIRTAAMLAAVDESFLRSKFSVSLAKTALELRGIPAMESENPEEASKSISCSRSFGRPVTNFEEAREGVADYLARAAEKMRAEHLRASGMNIYFQFYPEYEPQKLAGVFTSATVLFDPPAAATQTLLEGAAPKLKEIFLPGRRCKKAGVVFFGLERPGERVTDLFEDTVQTEKSDRLSAIADAVNRKFGRGSLFALSEGIAKPWAMKRDRLSPAWTTRWNEIPKAK